MAKYPSWEKEARRIASRKWYKKNLKKARAYKRNYQKKWVLKKTENREKALAWAQRWRDANRDKISAYNAANIDRQLAYIKKNRRKMAAHQYVYMAIKKGFLTRPVSCQQCNLKCKPHGHHHKGYEGADRLDVLWLCSRCHRRAHSKCPF